MSIAQIILINVLAASILVLTLAAVMLAPSRLRRPFAEGHTRRQWAALLAQWRAQARQFDQRGREAHWRAIEEL